MYPRPLPRAPVEPDPVPPKFLHARPERHEIVSRAGSRHRFPPPGFAADCWPPLLNYHAGWGGIGGQGEDASHAQREN